MTNFNPIIVRFKLPIPRTVIHSSSAFQSYNSSIQTTASKVLLSFFVKFQSYNSSIQTSQSFVMPLGKLLVFQSYNSSIQTLSARDLRTGAKEFQSYNSSIQTCLV